MNAIPGWDGIHPMLVHVPIALLIVAPALLVVSLVLPRRAAVWSGAALIVMALGAGFAWLAVASGHAAGQLVDKTPALSRAIGDHEALGVKTRDLFTLLTVVLAALLALPSLMKKPWPAALRNGVHVAFLVVYIGCLSVLIATMGRGTRLVHDFGVKPIVGHSGQSAAAVDEPPAPASAAGGGLGNASR